jgi:SLT domain-containing protein
MPPGDGVSVGSIFGRLGYRFDDSGSKEFEQSRRKHEAETRKPIKQPLGFDVDNKVLADYHRELDKIRARTTRRDEFKAKLGADFDARAFRAYEAELRKAEQQTRRFAEQQRTLSQGGQAGAGPFGDRGFSAGASGSAFRSLYKQAGQIVFGGLAAQGVSAGVAGGGALAAGAAPLAGALAAYPALATAAAQGLGVFKLATEKIFPVVGGLNSKLDESTKAFKELTPEAQKFARQLEALKKPLRDLPTIAQKGLLPGLADGIKDASKNLPVLKGIVRDTAGALGELATQAGALVGSKSFGRDLQVQGERNVTTLKRGGEVALNLADAFRHVVLAAGPLVDWITRGAVKLSELVDKQARAGRESGALARFFHETQIEMSRVARIAGDVATALVNIGKQAYPLGSDLLRVITLNAEKFKDWTASAQGRNSIAEFFARARPALDELGRLLVDVTKTFFRLGNGQQVAPLLQTLRTQLLPVLEKVINSTTTAFGPVFLETLTQALLLFSHIAGSSGPLVEFTKLMGGILAGLNRLIDRVPALGTALSAIVALGGIAKALQLAAAVTGVTKLIGLLKTARTAAAGVAVAEGAGGAAAGAGAAGAGAAAGRLGQVGAGAAGVLGGLGVGLAVSGGLKGVFESIRGGRASDLGLLDSYAKAIERVAKAGDAPGMRKLADQLRATAQANHDLTRGENLKAFATILDKTADTGGQDLSALAAGFDRLGKHSKASLDDTRDALHRLVARSSPDFAAVRGEADATRKRFRTMSDFTKGSLEDIYAAVRDNMGRVQSRLKSDSSAGKAALADNFEQAIGAVRKSMRAGVTATKDGMGAIRDYVAQELGVYGISLAKARSIAKQGYTGDDAFRAAGRGQGEGKAGGGWIGEPGMVGGDVVPAMLAPGEAVLNRHQQAVIEGMLGGGFLDRLFSSVTTPHYMASGGRAGGLQPAVASLAGRLNRMFGLSTTSTTGGQHAANSYHYLGLAADLGGPPGAMAAASRYLMSSGVYRSLLEGIHNPGLSVKSGSVVPSSYWGGAWAQHANHIHIALSALGRAMAGVTGGSVPIPKITGGGAIGRLAQAALGVAGAGANRLLSSATAGLGAADTGDVRGRGRGASDATARGWIAAGLRLAGVPASAGNISTVLGRARQESGLDPSVVNTWDINAKRGDPSIGLLQTTGSTFRRYMVRGHGNIRNPVDNTAAAVRYMLATYGHLVGAGPGGYARGGFVGRLARRFASGGYVWPNDHKRHTITWDQHLANLPADVAAALRFQYSPHGPAKGTDARGPQKGNTPDQQEALQASRDAQPTQLDYLQAAIAEAELTDTLDDDKAAYQALVSYDEQALTEARSTRDPRLIVAAANALKSARDTLKSLVNMVTPDQQAQLDQALQRAQIAETASGINAAALSTLGVFDPSRVGQAGAGAPNAFAPTGGPTIDLGNGVQVPAGAGITVVQTHFNTAFPPSPQQAEDAARGVVAGLGYQGRVQSPREVLI